MSKAVGKIFGGGAGASTSMYGGEQEILNYLNNYNTANYDTTLNNLTAYAANASNRLAGMGDYQFNVAASDDARQRAEQAVYQSYVDKLRLCPSSGLRNPCDLSTLLPTKAYPSVRRPIPEL